VTSRELRHLAIDHGFLVTLTASIPVLLGRLGDLSTRPVLGARDPTARLASLLEARREAYAECHLELSTEGLSPEAAAACVVTSQLRRPILVPHGSQSYAVHVVNGSATPLEEEIRRASPSSLLLVMDENVSRARGHSLVPTLASTGLPLQRVTLPAGEAHKSISAVTAIWDAALGTIDRQALVIGFGGGVVGDLAGFAASTLLRGVRSVLLPTTVLAMADASVGGKTGFDHAAGKNLVGTFHRPNAVVADLAHLSTLPQREYISGLAEIAKVALSCDAALWASLETSAESLLERDLTALAPILVSAIEAKAKLVRDDERESGARRILNLGHTIGHALEADGGYTELRHGEAVALGLVAECQLATRLGVCPPELERRVQELLRRLGLPTSVKHDHLARGWRWVHADKKRAGGSLFFPLPTAIGAATVSSLSLSVVARTLGVDG
jgi:shikimate kinase/3-dehydroquinate synthase